MLSAESVKLGTTLACVLWLNTAQHGYAKNLEDYLGEVYASNPTLLAERANLRSTDEEIPQAISGLRPSVNISAQKGFSHQDITGGTALQDSFYDSQFPTSVYRATLSQSLLGPGRTLAQFSAAKDDIVAERAHLVSVEQQVFLQATTDYLDVIRDESVLALHIDNERMLEAKRRAEYDRLSKGGSTRVDVAQADAAYDGAVADRHAAEGDLETSRINFARDVGEAPHDLTSPDASPALPSKLEEAEAQAASSNPDVISSLYKLRASEELIRSASRQSWPTVDMSASIGHQDDAQFKGARSNDLTIYFRLNWQLYQGGEVESQVRAAEETRSKLQYQLVDARTKVSSDLAKAWARRQSLLNAEKSQDLAIKANTTAAEGVQMQARGGNKTILDVLEAEHALLQSRIDLAKVKHDKLLQEFTLLASVGRLTAKELFLRTRLYDPEKSFRSVEFRWF